MKKLKFFIAFMCAIIFMKSNIVKANWAGCHAALKENTPIAVGDVLTYEVGSTGVTANRNIYGIHYEMRYDPDVLEPVSVEQGGIGSYYNWEIITSEIEGESGIRYDTLIVDVKTNDKNKYIISNNYNYSSDMFVKLAYIKFKVKETNQKSTSIILVQTYQEDLKNGFLHNEVGSTSSYKYGYSPDDGKNSQEVCYDTVNTFVSIYKKAYLTGITINDTPISNFSKDVYTYNIESTTKEITIKASTETGYSIIGGTGTKTLSYGNNQFKIKVRSNTGDEKEYTLNINYPDNRSDINTLNDINLSVGEIDFNSSNTTYNVEVDYAIDKITISSSLTDSKASYVKNYGNREVSLNEGLNTVLLKVKSEKGNEKTYTLNIIRKEKDDTCDIKDININGYKLNFDLLKTNYTLDIDSEVSSLDISVELVDLESKYMILGNEDLDNGSVITIEVTDKNGKIKNYYINIIKKTEAIPTDSKDKNGLLIIIIPAALLIILGITLFTNKK